MHKAETSDPSEKKKKEEILGQKVLYTGHQAALFTRFALVLRKVTVQVRCRGERNGTINGQML